MRKKKNKIVGLTLSNLKVQYTSLPQVERQTHNSCNEIEIWKETHTNTDN
jgi:hypothetical protein